MTKKVSCSSDVSFCEMIKPWLRIILAGILAASTAVGCYERGFPYSPAWLILAGIAAGLSSYELICRLRSGDGQNIPNAISIPLLWTATVWVCFRLVGAFAPQVIILATGYLAWLCALYPPTVFLPSVIAVCFIEGGLFWAGYQSGLVTGLNLVFYMIAVALLHFFTRTKVYRRQRRRALASARLEAGSKEYARDLGLFPAIGDVMEYQPKLDSLDGVEAESQLTVAAIAASFDLQLDLLRRALHLTTAAIIWPDQQGRELRLRSLATVRRDIRPGPYPVGSGIVGALLRAKEELTLSQLKSDFNGLPYYQEKGGVGSLMAIKIPDDGLRITTSSERKIAAILCVDRESPDSWDEEALQLLRLTARLLSGHVFMGRRLQRFDLEKNALLRVCVGLRALNSVLGLEAATEATINAVRALTPADFVAVSLVEDDKHRIERAEGVFAEELQGRSFDRQDGLVGQVLKMNRRLPAGGEYRGPAPIFARAERFSDFGSLLIMPLRKEGGGTIGALTVAALEAKKFSKARRDILELIASQAAIKIDLAQSHERINQMATTDGLTGLANHRTFQHAFEVMLQRAERQQSCLSLILCDIDHFKKVNDTHGHPFGDEVLRSVAQVVKKTIRSVDLAARYGGEEFVVVLENTDCSGGVLMAERIRREVESMHVKNSGRPVQVTMSLGIVSYPKDKEEKSSLISCADQALYLAKNNGRNRVVAWQTSQQEAAGSSRDEPVSS